MSDPFWNMPVEALCTTLRTSTDGLSDADAAARLLAVGPNTLRPPSRRGAVALLLHQFVSPIVLILLVAAVLSFTLGQRTDGLIVVGIVLVSGVLGFWQEHRATSAVAALLHTVALTATVRRQGRQQEVPLDTVVPGDVILLRAGDTIPGDCLLLDEQDLFVDESALTGESVPVDKSPSRVAIDTPIARRTNVLFLGTHVVSGSGRALVVLTGTGTAFGAIAEHLRVAPGETAFEHGVRRFGTLLLEVTFVLVLAIFAINVYFHRPVVEAFLFTLALAVGLTPQLLPAIISVTLATGARRMAARQVIVRRLAAIENFGSMDVLCVDKTGTLTDGTLRVQTAVDVHGLPSDRVREMAMVNATFETAFRNPIDAALRAPDPAAVVAWHKCDEVPYDFQRKRLSVLAQAHGQTWLITKGALHAVLDVCTHASIAPDGTTAPVPIDTVRDEIDAQDAAFSAQGFRTLGVAVRLLPTPVPIHREDEAGLTFLGLIALADTPKVGIADTVASLQALGIRVVMITGDTARVAEHVGAQVGLGAGAVITGDTVRTLTDAALRQRAASTTIFAEIEPTQKERIVRALRSAGRVVGYLGDGINDAPALHAADVSISVQEAVDVAKAAADIVLLEHDLRVLADGVREGRRTLANTLKYVLAATSANVGNMFSMAGASLVLPFLPLLPKQILLTNVLTDIPELTIASDAVDAEWIAAPRRWDVGEIRRFMVTFGLVSSVFDFLTFALLLRGMQATEATFRTGWFVESVVSATCVVLVVRTRGPLLRSRPAPALLAATGLVLIATVTLPYTGLGRVFGFVPLPPQVLGWLGGIVVTYVVTAEGVKRWLAAARARAARRSSEPR